MITSVFQSERWMRSPPPLGNPFTPTLPPDIVLLLDDEKSTKFFAHRFVLAYHSGYFRTLFASYNGFEVHISNVDPAIFSILLNYMYTGQLHVNAKNAYDLLTASDFLYMLSVADFCKEYLREQRSENVRTTPVIRPVPRKNPATVSAASRQAEVLKYQPLRINDDNPSSIFKPVGANIADRLARASPGPSSPEKFDEHANVDSNSQRKHEEKSETKTPSVDKIIYDIACCDGPIKFRRVVNQFYKPWKSNERHASHSSDTYHDCKIVVKSYRGRLRKSSNVASFLFQKCDDVTASNDSETRLSTHGQGNEKSATGDEDMRNVRNASKNDVQYYPCKSCGSKFPSYYFVNKHRKLCHTNESGLSTIDN